MKLNRRSLLGGAFVGAIGSAVRRAPQVAAQQSIYTTTDMNTGGRPDDFPPLDSPVVWSRKAVDPGEAYHPQNTVTFVGQGTGKNSFFWNVLSYMATTDHPDASIDTSQNVGFYSIIHKLARAWGAAFHADLYHPNDGVSVIYNGEHYRTSPAGTVIGVNVQQSGTYGGDVAFQASGVWGTVLRSTVGGTIVAVGDKPILTVDASGDPHLGERGVLYAGTIRQGPGDILQTFTADGRLLRTIYADPYGSHIIGTANNIVTRADGSVEINGDLHITGSLIVNGRKIA